MYVFVISWVSSTFLLYVTGTTRFSPVHFLYIANIYTLHIIFIMILMVFVRWLTYIVLILVKQYSKFATCFILRSSKHITQQWNYNCTLDDPMLRWLAKLLVSFSTCNILEIVIK
jgi:hypothetical protein